jgi:hypothetical protein
MQRGRTRWNRENGVVAVPDRNGYTKDGFTGVGRRPVQGFARFADNGVQNPLSTDTEERREHMAKHKSSIHLPPPPAAPASRLAVQLLTAAGELVIIAACVLGLVTAGSWLIAGAELHSRSARQPAVPREVWHCRWDRRYGGDICEPPYRLPPVRRYFMRDHV